MTEPMTGPVAGPVTGPTGGEARDRILWLLRAFGEAIEHLQHDWAAAAALHPSDLAAITHLRGSEVPLTMRGLGERLELSPGAITALVDRLEARGHVARGSDPTDRRRVTVELSPSAHELAGRFFGELAARVSTELEGFDDDELATIARFLERMPGAVAPGREHRAAPRTASDVHGPR
jgi:DNA-binding MarR family transcriptional regulator